MSLRGGLQLKANLKKHSCKEWITILGFLSTKAIPKCCFSENARRDKKRFLSTKAIPKSSKNSRQERRRKNFSHRIHSSRSVSHL